EWEAFIGDRTRRDRAQGCAACAGKKVSVTNSLATRAPTLLKSWHSRNQLSPDQLIAGSQKKYWWRCDVSPEHDWEASPAHRLAGTGCPYCRGLKVCSTNSLEVQSPDVAAQWARERNGSLTPDRVAVKSGKIAWWCCGKH